MSDDRELLDDCASILKDLTPPLRWMTAAGLSKKLNGKYAPDRITLALRRHAQTDKRTIRYSFYPSRKTISDLWGHIDVVKEHRSPPELERRDAMEELGFLPDHRACGTPFYLYPHGAPAVGEYVAAIRRRDRCES